MSVFPEIHPAPAYNKYFVEQIRLKKKSLRLPQGDVLGLQWDNALWK